MKLWCMAGGRRAKFSRVWLKPHGTPHPRPPRLDEGARPLHSPHATYIAAPLGQPSGRGDRGWRGRADAPGRDAALGRVRAAPAPRDTASPCPRSACVGGRKLRPQRFKTYKLQLGAGPPRLFLTSCTTSGPNSASKLSNVNSIQTQVFLALFKSEKNFKDLNRMASCAIC